MKRNKRKKKIKLANKLRKQLRGLRQMLNKQQQKLPLSTSPNQISNLNKLMLKTLPNRLNRKLKLNNNKKIFYRLRKSKQKNKKQFRFTSRKKLPSKLKQSKLKHMQSKINRTQSLIEHSSSLQTILMKLKPSKKSWVQFFLENPSCSKLCKRSSKD